jgi:hypothetical protein
MSVLLSVLKDLWDFSLVSLGLSKHLALNETALTKTLLLEAAHASNQHVIADPEVRSLKIESEPVISELSFGSKAFIVVNKSSLFHRPVWTFDGSFMSIPYSTEVRVLSYEGRFVRISYKSFYGFILKEDIEDNIEKIFPNFQISEIYSANHPDTKKVRKYFKDEFFAEVLFLPLQSVEFAYYRLLLDNRRIEWSEERPRLAGNWANILKGKMGVQIGIVPKTGSIMEYLKPDGSGFVGYVKSVLIDESIIVVGVGRVIDGEYSEEAISREKCLSLSPVFISVT